MIEIPNYLVHLKFAILKGVSPYLEDFYGFNFPSVSHVGAFTQVNERAAPVTEQCRHAHTQLRSLGLLRIMNHILVCFSEGFPLVLYCGAIFHLGAA